MYTCRFVVYNVYEVIKMASEAKLKANKKYLNTLEDIKIRVPKDGTKERYKKYAESKGISLNKLFIDLIDQDIKENS